MKPKAATKSKRNVKASVKTWELKLYVAGQT
jgi:hypothetical protein